MQRLNLFLLVAFFFTASAGSGAQTTALFNGRDLSGWTRTKGGDPAWTVRDGYLEVVPGSGDIQTTEAFDDFELHAEFWVPFMPDKHGQDRGNSGIFLQGRYEIQILDSYGNETYADGACGALYKLIAPLVNASFPPENWQTYDIQFLSPRLGKDGKVQQKGVVTVVQNGIVVIDRGEFDRPTGSAAKEKQGVPGPIRLQDHGSSVRFRNLQLRKR